MSKVVVVDDVYAEGSESFTIRVLVGEGEQLSVAGHDPTACNGLFVHHFGRVPTAVRSSGNT